METPSRHSYALDGATRVFPVSSPIKGDNYCRLEVDGVIVNDRAQYDIVNNSIVFLDTSLLPSGSQLDVLVVQSEEAIGQLAITTNIDIVSQNIANVNIVGDDIANVGTVATNIADVNSVATNMAEVLTADTNAAIATTKAAEAAQSEANADADAVQTAADRVQTGLDTVATAADRVQTGLDKVATAADRVQTGLDAASAGQSAFDANVSEANASASAFDANASASTATTQAGIATTQAGVAALNATSAADSASSASTSASNAAASATSAQASLDEFQGQYHGALATAPTVGVDTGDLYFDTTANEMRVYDGTNWISTATVATSTDEVTVTQGQTVVDTTLSIQGTTTLALYINGVKQYPTAYALTGSSEVTFNEALQEGDVVQFVVNETLATGIKSNQISGLQVATIADLPSGSNTDQQATVVSDENHGGTFIWEANVAKTEHNGGTIIDPDVDMSTWTYTSANAGNGVWRRQFDGSVNVKWFGAVGDGVSDDTSAIQAATNTVRLSKDNKKLDGDNIPILLDSGFIHNQGDSGLKNFSLYASDSFSSVDTDEALLKKKVGLRMSYSDIDLDCNNVSNGLYVESGGFGSNHQHIEVSKIKQDGYGLKISGSGDQRLSDSIVSGSSEVSERGTSVGVNIDTGDFKLNDNVIRYANIPLKTNGTTLLATGNHFYNGSAGSATPATNSINVQIDGGNGQSFCHTYLDKGRIDLVDSFNNSWFDTKLLFNTVPEHDEVVRMTTTSINTEFPDGFQWDGCQSTIPLNNGDMKFVTFRSNGAGSWNDEATSIKDEINLRSNGYPRIVQGETCHVVNPNLSYICKGDTQTIKHSLGSLTYSQNTTNAVNEVYKNSYVGWDAAGITAEVEATGTGTNATLRVTGSRTNFTPAAEIQLRNRKGSASFDDTNGAYWSIESVGRSNAGHMDDLKFRSKDPLGTTITERLRYSVVDSTFRAGDDNSTALGTASNRWSVVYAGTGAINTSDDREKTYLDITEVEKEVALELKKNMRKFKFNDSIEAKGNDDARIHFGTSAQTVKAIFERHGLVAEKYGLFCYDEWEQEVDNEGNVTIEAGNRYGIRYEELFSFIISAL
jgi:hypothetical protein